MGENIIEFGQNYLKLRVFEFGYFFIPNLTVDVLVVNATHGQSDEKIGRFLETHALKYVMTSAPLILRSPTTFHIHFLNFKYNLQPSSIIEGI